MLQFARYLKSLFLYLINKLLDTIVMVINTTIELIAHFITYLVSLLPVYTPPDTSIGDPGWFNYAAWFFPFCTLVQIAGLFVTFYLAIYTYRRLMSFFQMGQ